jgi:anti-sigma B factor antagonist
VSDLNEVRLREVERTGIQVIDIVGEVNIYNVSRLREVLSAAILRKPSEIVVNLSDVRYIDSSGLGVLLGGLKRLRAEGGSIRIAAANAFVTKVLVLTGMTNIFPVFATVTEAIQNIAA